MISKFASKYTFFYMADDSVGSNDDNMDNTGDDINTGGFSNSLREKRARAGRAGGTKTASLYNMREIGAMGGKAAQARGTAHKLTKEERARGGAHSRRS